MDVRLAGRRALVTGAGTDGIGRAVALALGEAGADVAIHHLAQADAARETARRIAAAGPRTAIIRADFAEEGAARRCVREATDALGPLDILVCTSAILLRKPALELADDDWRRVHRINLEAYFSSAQEAARGMAERGHGRIVMISSVNQWTPNPGLVAYASAKAGVMQLARSLALELAPRGVTVNLVAPGTIETDFNRAALGEPEYRRQKTAFIPAGRLGTPVDVAAAVVFLASDQAGYITGTTITVDGGLELRP
ncbi:MAG: SDR family oxidoreductase [Alphaproteobacteria bacterium]|nr:SDR family oxidoreductase [Alphaproteobacteria bacterium]